MSDQRPELPEVEEHSTSRVEPVKPAQAGNWWRRNGPKILWGIVGLAGAGLIYLYMQNYFATLRGRGTAERMETAQPAIPVVATRARRGNIGVFLNGLGSITPIYTVSVRSRVDGELTEVRYREGQMVKQGELLIQIDPRPFEAQLLQAQGQLERDEATLRNARIDLSRFQMLVAQNAAPQQQYATQQATVAQLEGTLKLDQAQVESARLNLIYSRITAPISGRVGLRLVDPGNQVRAADTTPLVVITQIQPITAIFTLPEDQLPKVFDRMREGKTLRADAYDRDMKTLLAQGKLTSIDNQIDQTTGTVRLRATFENLDSRLFPNEFVNIRLLVEERRNVVLLHTAAIQRSNSHTYVYVVSPGQTVSVRQIEVGVTDGDNTEITSGLNGGEVVVMTGVDNLQEGSRVTVQMENQGATGKKGGKK